MKSFIHTRDRLLSRIAARQVAPGPLTRGHLARCQRCRSRIAFMRSLEDGLVKLDGPIAGEDLWRRIRERMAERDTVLLPAEGTAVPIRRTGRALAAAAIVAAVLGLWILSPNRGVQASTTAGDLILSPSALIPGTVVEVTYRDAGQFSAETLLVLRARLRGPNDEAYNTALRQRAITTLMSKKRGTFKGTFRVPDSVVYASFAVENAAGTRVDSRNRQLWALAATTSDGRPTFDGLTQAYNDLIDGDPERALEALRERSRLYPEHPAAWSDLLNFERFMLGNAHVDSLIPRHRPTVLRLHGFYSGRDDVPIEIAHGLWFYAAAVGDSAHPELREIGLYWRARVLADTAGTSLRSRAYRLFAAQDSVAKYPARVVAAYERAWMRGDSIVDFAAQNGFNFARMARDSAAIIRWADRLAQRNPRVLGAWPYMQLAADSAYREVGLERLRVLARWLSGPRDPRKDALRPLELSIAEQAREDSAEVSGMLAAIGKALIAGGRNDAALDTLDLATRGTWNAALFRQVGDLRLAARDSTGAATAFALAAVDPQVESAIGDSLRRRVRASTAVWSELTRNAHEEMRRRVFAGAISRSLAGSPRLSSRDGRVASLDDLAGGQVTVVTFWSRYCGPSRLQVPQLPALERQLAKHGIKLIAITAEEPSPSLDEFIRDSNVAFPVFYDRAAEMRRSFNTTRTPDYFVLDPGGRIRFANTQLGKVLVQAVALTPDTIAAGITSPSGLR